MRMQEHDDYSDVFTLDEWENIVKAGAVSPEDGSGYYATSVKFDRDSPVFYGEEPYWATHVAWYNK